MSLTIVGGINNPLKTPDPLNIGTIKAKTSAGVLIESNNGTDVALFGAGGGAGATFYDGINATGHVLSRPATTNDAMCLSGRAGGSSSYECCLTPLTLTASRTWSVPDRDDTVAGLKAQTFTEAQTIDLGTGVLPAAPYASNLLFANIDGNTGNVAAMFYTFGPTCNGSFAGLSAGNTRASPGAAPDGKSILNFNYYQHNGTSYVLSGQFVSEADGLQSVTNAGLKYRWRGASNGATSATDWMFLQNSCLGIGAAPSTGTTDKLQVYGSQTIDLGTGALPAALADCVLRIAQANTVAPRIEFFGYSASGVSWRGRAIGGTRASPSATTSGQAFHQFGAFGHDGSNYVTGQKALLSILADGDWSGTNNGTYYNWNGTPNGSTVSATWMVLQNAALGIGAAPTTGNGLLQLASGTTKANGIAFGTDTFLYRSAANTIKTDGDFIQVGGQYHYLRGDASTDGSIRDSSPSSGVAIREIRKSGVWTTVQTWS